MRQILVEVQLNVILIVDSQLLILTNRITTSGLTKMTELSKENASQLVTEFLKFQKNTDKVDIAFVERQNDCWIVSGTTPIQFGEMQWPERFAVIVDLKGRIKSTDFKLL